MNTEFLFKMVVRKSLVMDLEKIEADVSDLQAECVNRNWVQDNLRK